MRIGDYIIVNSFDRPHSQLIAVVIGTSGKTSISAKYVNIDRPIMEHVLKSEATLVTDFGVDLFIDGEVVLAKVNGKESTAKYPDGKQRKWQGR